ncbi:MAG TPA: hypothetical protein VN724_08625 [Pyrinomonadaceae bacterium]|nr:hypothetical protein [Pyrinomonadaceae bacterium]
MTLSTEGKVAVLEWRAWKGFLLNHVLREKAVQIEVDPFCELPSDEFERICDSFTTVCFQINLSVRSRLPLRIRDLTDRFKERGIYVVNGLVQDIRKSTLHAHLEAIGLNSPGATQSGAADEMLFVKTNLNYGGDLERWLPPESIAAGGLEHLVSPIIRGAYYYQTLERKMLHADMWTDPAIVIEKYVTNSENTFYRVYFSGQQVIIVKAFAQGVIKKLSSDPRDTNYVTDLEHLKAGKDRLEISATLKREVTTFVDQSPVEFGCIDIVHDDNDNHYIIDLNLTPYAGNRGPQKFLIDFLRKGITSPTERKLTKGIDSPLAAF